MTGIRLLPWIGLFGLLGACSNVPTLPGVTPYRIEIQQGNYISQEMVSQLKPGMTREQVRFVLGTPLVTDIFHADRWDYVYTREPPGKPREQRKLSVFFVDGKLSRVSGDVVPAGSGEAPAPAKPAAAARPSLAPVPAPAPATAEAPPKPNWRAASDDPDYGKEPKPPAEPPKPAAEAAPAEKGLFGRMLDRLKGD